MEIISFLLFLLIFILSFIAPKVVFLISISLFPFYKVIGTISVFEAEISSFEGIVFALFFSILIMLPTQIRKTRFFIFDLLVLFWIIINSIPFLFSRTDIIYALNTYRNITAVPIALYFIIRIVIKDSKSLLALFWVISLSTSALAFFGIMEFLNTYHRIETFLGGSHSSSIVMTAGMFSSVYLFLTDRNFWPKILLVLPFFLNFFGVILCLSRIIIPAIFILPFLTLIFIRVNKATAIVFILIFVLIGFSFPLKAYIYDEGLKAFHKQQQRAIDPKTLSRLTDETQVKAALGVRTLPYYISIKYIKERPIFGYGYSIHKELKEKQGFSLAHSHNIGLDILLRTGFIGLISFTAIIVSFVTSVIDIPKSKTVRNVPWFLFLSLVFIILANSFANSMSNLATCCVFWMSIAIVACHKSISKQESKS